MVLARGDEVDADPNFIHELTRASVRGYTRFIHGCYSMDVPVRVICYADMENVQHYCCGNLIPTIWIGFVLAIIRIHMYIL